MCKNYFEIVDVNLDIANMAVNFGATDDWWKVLCSGLFPAILGGIISGSITLWAVKSTSESDKKNRKYENIYKLYQNECIKIEPLVLSCRKYLAPILVVSEILNTPTTSIKWREDNANEIISLLDELWNVVFSIKSFLKGNTDIYDSVLRDTRNLLNFLKYLDEETKSFRNFCEQDELLSSKEKSSRFKFIASINKFDCDINLGKAFDLFNEQESSNVKIGFEFLKTFDENLVKLRKSIRNEFKVID